MKSYVIHATINNIPKHVFSDVRFVKDYAKIHRTPKANRRALDNVGGYYNTTCSIDNNVLYYGCMIRCTTITMDKGALMARLRNALYDSFSSLPKLKYGRINEITKTDNEVTRDTVRYAVELFC